MKNGKTFFLDSEFNSPKLSLMIKSVVPVAPHEIKDSTEYLDKIYINDVEVGILNLFVIPELETSDFWTLLDPNPLRIGNNTIKITSGSNEEGSNYDDFEFFNLELKGIRKTGWVLSGMVKIGNEPTTYACVNVYHHGTNERVSYCITDNNGSYSIKLSNGVYDVKAVKEFSPEFGTQTVVINNSNVTLDFEISHLRWQITLALLLLFPVIIFILQGFAVAIVVSVFTKKGKLSVIGFVLGAIAAFTVTLVLRDLLGIWLLPLSPLSTGIALIMVAVPIILLNKRKSKVEGGGEL